MLTTLWTYTGLTFCGRCGSVCRESSSSASWAVSVIMFWILMIPSVSRLHSITWSGIHNHAWCLVTGRCLWKCKPWALSRDHFSFLRLTGHFRWTCNAVTWKFAMYAVPLNQPWVVNQYHTVVKALEEQLFCRLPLNLERPVATDTRVTNPKHCCCHISLFSFESNKLLLDGLSWNSMLNTLS